MRAQNSTHGTPIYDLACSGSGYTNEEQNLRGEGWVGGGEGGGGVRREDGLSNEQHRRAGEEGSSPDSSEVKAWEHRFGGYIALCMGYGPHESV